LEPKTLSFGDNKKSLLVKQGIVNKDHTTLRYHAIKIAFFNKELEVVSIKEITIPNEEEYILDVSDVPEYEAVFLNFEDQDFVQTRLDDKSFNFFQENISKFEDDLTRALLLRAFFDSLINGKTDNKTWNTIVCDFITSESKVNHLILFSNIVGTTLEFCFQIEYGSSHKKYPK